MQKLIISALIALLTMDAIHAQRVIVRYIDIEAMDRAHEAHQAWRQSIQDRQNTIRIEQWMRECWKHENDLALWKLKFSGGKHETPEFIYEAMRTRRGTSYPTLKTPEEVAKAMGRELPEYYTMPH
jgi:hypothetical protein